MSEEYINMQETSASDNYLDTNYSKELIGAFIGNNAEYYFKKWEKSINPEKKSTFNWAAFILGMFWLGYRKMYRFIFIILVLFIFLDIIQFLLNLDINPGIGAALGVVLGMSGNYLYFREMKKKLAVLGEQKNNKELSLDDAKEIGGTSWKGVGISVLLVLIYVVVSIIITTIP